jgi:hypothetical protein
LGRLEMGQVPGVVMIRNIVWLLAQSGERNENMNTSHEEGVQTNRYMQILLHQRIVLVGYKCFKHVGK